MAVDSGVGAGLGRSALQATEPTLVPGRGCGSCSLCCKLHPVAELNKPAGRWCVHSRPGSGCSIHDRRPQACRRFFCAWLLDPTLGPEWKPEVARFVLAVDPVHQALTVMADPGMPLAWKREPYYSRLKQLSERLFAEDKRALVNVRGQITVILPDRDVPLGVLPRGAEIAIWRQGSTYGARLQPPRDEVGLLKSAFLETFAQASTRLDDSSSDDLAALDSIARERNKMLDETARAYAKTARAQCQAGCTSCCYLLVMATPFEVLSIARHLLEGARTPAEIEQIKRRLRRLSEVPIDLALRAEARMPCALLEDGRCSIYEQRPTVCRVLLSQSRAACDACLQGAASAVPAIEPPSKVAAASQMGLDYALITRRNLSVELVELSRALLIALGDYRGALRHWLAGEDPFASARVEARGAPSSAEKAVSAAQRFGVA